MGTGPGIPDSGPWRPVALRAQLQKGTPSPLHQAPGPTAFTRAPEPPHQRQEDLESHSDGRRWPPFPGLVQETWVPFLAGCRGPLPQGNPRHSRKPGLWTPASHP